MRRHTPALVAVGLVLLVLPTDAAAYIDPAAGSILLQALLGGVAGFLVIGKLYYRKLMTFFGRRPRDDGSTQPGDQELGSR